MSSTNESVLTLERRGHVLLIGLNRPQKRNAFNIALLTALGGAYEQLERDDELRCGVLYAHWCMTLGIELLLAADIRVASSDARFAQLEIQRGIYPFGGATIRLPREAGWGNSMRWLLTGDEYDATEAHRIGLIQEITEPAALLDRAIQLAESIATRSAPLGVRTTLISAQRALREGHAAAEARLNDDMVALLRTEDGAEGMMSFIERRAANFTGR